MLSSISLALCGLKMYEGQKVAIFQQIWVAKISTVPLKFPKIEDFSPKFRTFQLKSMDKKFSDRLKFGGISPHHNALLHIASNLCNENSRASKFSLHKHQKVENTEIHAHNITNCDMPICHIKKVTSIKHISASYLEK